MLFESRIEAVEFRGVVCGVWGISEDHWSLDAEILDLCWLNHQEPARSNQISSAMLIRLLVKVCKRTSHIFCIIL